MTSKWNSWALAVLAIMTIVVLTSMPAAPWVTPDWPEPPTPADAASTTESNRAMPAHAETGDILEMFEHPTEGMRNTGNESYGEPPGEQRDTQLNDEPSMNAEEHTEQPTAPAPNARAGSTGKDSKAPTTATEPYPSHGKEAASHSQGT